MTAKEAYQLKDGDEVLHNHYGPCTVKGTVPDFGVKVSPYTDHGLALLRHHSGSPSATVLLEDSFRLLKKKAEAPTKPKNKSK